MRNRQKKKDFWCKNFWTRVEKIFFDKNHQKLPKSLFTSHSTSKVPVRALNNDDHFAVMTYNCKSSRGWRSMDRIKCVFEIDKADQEMVVIGLDTSQSLKGRIPFR